jgi:hypothetical protein
MTSRVMAAVMAAVFVATGACASRPQAAPPAEKPADKPVPQPGKPGKTPTEQPKPAANGVVDVSINGSERISCDSIGAEVELVAKDGTARWSASAKRSPNFADKLAAQGVQVSPASGELAEGDTAVIKVRGEFDKSNKYFYVVVVSRDGSTSHSVEFKCR